MTNVEANGGPYGIKLFCQHCRDEYEIRTPKDSNEVVNRILKFRDQHSNCAEESSEKKD